MLKTDVNNRNEAAVTDERLGRWGGGEGGPLGGNDTGLPVARGDGRPSQASERAAPLLAAPAKDSKRSSVGRLAAAPRRSTGRFRFPAPLAR